MQNATEKEELKKTLEESERKRSSKEVEISELGDMLDEVRRSNDSLSSQKMKLLTDLELLQVNILCPNTEKRTINLSLDRLIMMSKVSI